MWMPGAPTIPVSLSTGWPSRNIISVGMAFTPYLAGIRVFLSTSIRANCTDGNLVE